MYDWLLNHRVFGIFIYSYINYRAIDLKTKIMSISLLWITLFISIIVIEKIYMTIILAIIGLSVTYHLLSLKTMSKNEMIKRRNKQKILT